MPFYSQETDSKEKRCQSIYRNLLQSRSVAVGLSASVFIRELQHTSRCDEFNNLEDVRVAYKTFVGSDCSQRIESYMESELDERKAEQVKFTFGQFFKNKSQSTYYF
jgi:hypothetical protein